MSEVGSMYEKFRTSIYTAISVKGNYEIAIQFSFIYLNAV